MLRHPVWTLLVAVGVTVLSIIGMGRLTIQSNFADLLPEGEPAVQEMRRLEAIVGGASFVVLTVEETAPAIVEPFFAAIADRLTRHPDIRYVDYQPPTDFFRRHLLLYLPLPELRQFAERVIHRIDQAKLDDFSVDLTDPAAGGFNLRELEAKYPQLLQTNALYQNPEARLSVMLIKPRGRATDVQFTRRLLTTIDRAVAEAKATLAPTQPDIMHFRVQMTGPYVKAMTQNAIVVRDAKRVSCCSMLGMIGFLFAYFRRKRAVLLIGVPLVMSVTWAMGTAYLCFGTLNFFTAMASAVLLGLSTDYGIHLYSRYLDHRGHGLEPAQALWATYSHLGLALWAAALTTVVGFLTLTLSHFTAFYQFGLIIALGMLHCAIAMGTVFPALTLLLAKWRPEREAIVPGALVMKRWATRVARVAIDRRVFRLATAGVLLACIPLLMGRVGFNYDFGSILGAQTTRALDRAVDRVFTHSLNPEIARAETAEDAAAFAAAVRAAKARHAAEPAGTTIATALALADFVPPDQGEKFPIIRAVRAAFTPAVIQGLTPDEWEAYDRLRPALDPTPITFADLPPSILTNFQDLHGERGKFLFIFPNFDPMQGRQFLRFVEELNEVECPSCRSPVTYSGESVIFHEIVRRMFHDGRWVMGAALVGIWVALLLAFRRVRHAIRCFLPFLVGCCGMLGVMGAADVPFTLVSLAVVPILLGIAIDYPIYLYQQLLFFTASDHHTQLPHDPLIHAYTSIAPPILGSVMTTMIGFGSLLLAENGGARSFGLAAVIGLTTCALATLVWFPGWLARWQPQRAAERAPLCEGHRAMPQASLR